MIPQKIENISNYSKSYNIRIIWNPEFIFMPNDNQNKILLQISNLTFSHITTFGHCIIRSGNDISENK